MEACLASIDLFKQHEQQQQLAAPPLKVLASLLPTSAIFQKHLASAGFQSYIQKAFDPRQLSFWPDEAAESEPKQAKMASSWQFAGRGKASSGGGGEWRARELLKRRT